MAKSKDRIGMLRAALADLVDQQSVLSARIAELEAERDDLDGDEVDAVKVVDRLKDIGSELESLRRVQPGVDRRLVRLRIDLAEEQAKRNAEKVETIRPRERKAVEKVVDLTEKLEDALLDLDVLQNEIVRYGGAKCGRLPTPLWTGVQTAKQHWQMGGVWIPEGGSLRGA